MKAVFLFIFLVFGNPLIKKPMMKEVHELFQNAALEEKSCRKLIVLLEPYGSTNNPLLLGYKASAVMMMASHVLNPISKFKYFNKGKFMLEEAIATEPENLELRFLRFLAQTNIPFFLGYNDHIETDKKFILKYISGVKEIYLKEYIVSSLESSEALSQEEKFALKY